MEEGVTGQQFTLGFQPRTLIAQDFDQRVERLEPGIGDGGIGQGPQSLGGLQFWRIGEEGGPLVSSGSPFIVTDMEARPVLDHNHMVVRTRPHTVRKRCHDCLVGGLIRIPINLLSSATSGSWSRL